MRGVKDIEGISDGRDRDSPALLADDRDRHIRVFLVIVSRIQVERLFPRDRFI